MGPFHCMNLCSPPARSMTSAPGRRYRWKVLARIISAPISRTSSEVSPFTVACVPTGMKAGVRTTPRGVCRLPRRGPAAEPRSSSKRNPPISRMSIAWDGRNPSRNAPKHLGTRGVERMKRFLGFAVSLSVALVTLAPVPAAADSGSATYMLVMEVPNVAVAPHGDRVAVLGSGDFSVHPKSVTASGTFTHTDSAGTVRGAGTWTATDLLEFVSYGCGVLFGTPIPSNFCGGMLKLRVLLTTPIGAFDGILTVFCVIGTNPPNAVEEGVTLDVPGLININHITGWANA